MKNTKTKGNEGEEKAVLYLQEQGQKIIKRNYKGIEGEVDIIGEADDTLIFTEVKSFNSYNFEEVEYAVGTKKQGRIVKTAQQFLLQHPQYDNYFIRFDVIFLSGRTGELHHLINAFEGDGAPR